MFGMGSQELLLILVIVLVLFGGSKLPDLAKSLGKSMKEFKKGIGAEPEAEQTPKPQPAAPTIPAPPRACGYCKNPLEGQTGPTVRAAGHRSYRGQLQRYRSSLRAAAPAGRHGGQEGGRHGARAGPSRTLAHSSARKVASDTTQESPIFRVTVFTRQDYPGRPRQPNRHPETGVGSGEVTPRG